MDAQQTVFVAVQQVAGLEFDSQDLDRHADPDDAEAGMADDGAAVVPGAAAA